MPSAPQPKADGTPDFEAMSRHVGDLKAKYAQNAKNYEQNTGHPHPNLSSSQANSGGEGSGQEVGQSRGDADMDGPDGFADRAQPTDTSTGGDHGAGLAGQESTDGVGEKKSSVSAEGHGSHV